MKSLFGILILFATFTNSDNAHRGQNRMTITAEFPGATVQWLEIALPEIKKQGIDLNKYTVSVIESNDTVSVVLSSAGGISSQKVLGNAGNLPGYSVEVSKKTMQVVASNYVR